MTGRIQASNVMNLSVSIDEDDMPHQIYATLIKRSPRVGASGGLRSQNNKLQSKAEL